MIKKRFVFVIIICLLSGFLFSEEQNVIEPGYVLDYENCSETGEENPEKYDLTIGFIRNFSGKTISEMVICFTIIDKDGIPVGKSCLVLNDVGLKTDEMMPFDIIYKFVEEKTGVEVGYLDFIYISEIVYEDGTKYKDYGSSYFLSTIDPNVKKEFEKLNIQIGEFFEKIREANKNR